MENGKGTLMMLLPLLLQITATAAASIGAQNGFTATKSSFNRDDALSSSDADLYSIADCSNRLLGLPTANSSTSNSSVVYFVVLDAGSTGTRAVVHRFNWRPTGAAPLGLEYIGSVRHKRKPGLSAFGRYPRRCRGQLTSLLADAASAVPTELRSSTCLLLRATAGFRLMEARARHLVAKEARDVLRSSEFCVPGIGSVRMLSGAEEAKFTWLSVNYLLGRMTPAPEPSAAASGGAASTVQPRLTRPVLEMGGGSLQVAYYKNDGEDLVAGTRVRAHSYLGLGVRESVLRFLGHEDNATGYRTSCLAHNVSLKFSFGPVNVQINGTGVDGDNVAAEACLARGRKLISELEVQPEPALRGQNNWPIYAISGFYYLLKFIHSSNNRIGRVADACGDSDIICKAYTTTVGDIAKAARTVCLQIPWKGSFEPYYCINMAVTSALLTDGWQLPTTTPLVALGGQSALGWTLGLSLHHLTWVPGPKAKAAECPAADQPGIPIPASTAATTSDAAVTVALAVTFVGSVWRMTELAVWIV